MRRRASPRPRHDGVPLVGRDPTPGGMLDQSLVPGGDFLIKRSGGADKFINSNLDQGLQDRGIGAFWSTTRPSHAAI